MTLLGYSCDVISGGIPQNNKIKVLIGAHTCIQTVLTKVAQCDTGMSGHCIFKHKIKQLEGYTSIGWTGRVSFPRGGQNTPRSDVEGINN